jgi:hypothetical protein
MAAIRRLGKNEVQEKQECAEHNVVSCEEIAQAAYQLYVQRGCVDGRDLEDWLKAEVILRDRNGR